MENEEANRFGSSPWAGRRGLSAGAATIVMIVVILVVGGIGYYGLNLTGAKTETITSCTPASAPSCGANSAANDVMLFIPYTNNFGAQIFSTTEYANFPVTATLPSGELASSFIFNWGDGTTTTTAQPTATHAFSTEGLFLVSAQAEVNGFWHQSSRSLVPVEVTQSYASASSGNVPGIFAQVSSNGTAGLKNPLGVFSGSGTISVAAQYTSEPTNPAYIYHQPSLVVSSGGTLATPTITPTSAAGSATFTASGTAPLIGEVTFVGPSIASGLPTAYQNYTWTVYVAPTGVHAGVAASSTGPPPASPHKGSIYRDYVAPGGYTSLDPMVGYDTVSYEPDINTIQTLVQYNGSLTGATYDAYVPTLATCVPGSPQCQKLYGSTLISANGADWTFFIDPAARFYDPSTGASWPVYPSDVLFSLMRTMAYATDPSFAKTPGWIQAQTMLPLTTDPTLSANPAHSVWNTTPEWMMNAMSVNDSRYCSASQLTGTNGCITFHADGTGQLWPFFLEVVTDTQGSGIVPCSYVSANGGAIPGWTVTGTDHPCLLPGGATSTNSSAYQGVITSLGPNGFDSWEAQGANWPNINGNYLKDHPAGSGPYFVVFASASTGYTLKANPSYAQPTYCTWQPGCQPAPGHYASNVVVTYELTDTPGIAAYAAGQVDFATIRAPETPSLLALVHAGKISATTAPTLSIFFEPINFEINLATYHSEFNAPINIPSDFFDHLGLRQALVLAWPYSTSQNSILTVDGIQKSFPYGGPIPQFMANYYPTNISWPSTDPDYHPADVGSAGWWWQQANTPSSPNYDPELAACTPSSPCLFPVIGEGGVPELDQSNQLFISNVAQLTGGAIKPSTFDIPFNQLIADQLTPGQTGMPFYHLGWAPDYPDPTDYVPALVGTDNVYCSPDACNEALNTSSYQNAACKPGNDLGYWASVAVIPDNCQGNAWEAMQIMIQLAGPLPASPQRVLWYNMIDSIVSHLALYIYWYQQQTVLTYASWIDGSTVNTNVTIGGGDVFVWYATGGNGVY